MIIDKLKDNDILILNPSQKQKVIEECSSKNLLNIKFMTLNDLKENYGRAIKLYNSQIPLAVKTAESTSRGKSIFKYDKNSKVAIAYENFAKEVLADDRERQKNGTSKDVIR